MIVFKKIFSISGVLLISIIASNASELLDKLAIEQRNKLAIALYNSVAEKMKLMTPEQQNQQLQLLMNERDNLQQQVKDFKENTAESPLRKIEDVARESLHPAFAGVNASGVIVNTILGYLRADPSIILDSWLPPHVNQNQNLRKNALGIIGSDEQQETGVGDEPDFGFSFPANEAIHINALSSIRDFFIRTGKRPECLELGAGHGYFARNAIIAGGRVTAFEVLNVAEKMRLEMGNSKPFLRKGEALKDVLFPKKGNFLSYRFPQGKQGYNFITAFNVMHFFTPSQCEEFSKVLFQQSAPGALIYLMAGAPHGPNLEFYRKQENQGAQYPGFMTIKTLETAPWKTDTIVPTPNGKPLGYVWMEQPKIDMTLICTPIHVFTTQGLGTFFKKRGFDVLDAYYLSKDGERLEEVGTPWASTCIVLRKK